MSLIKSKLCFQLNLQRLTMLTKSNKESYFLQTKIYIIFCQIVVLCRYLIELKEKYPILMSDL